ncbi:MAG: fumarylacetoacetate hydrolase family protein [Planctomycetota bacterium]|nr:fumarylacetoacetate hydrolase family protein [Planctomycetota bacterium]
MKLVSFVRGGGPAPHFGALLGEEVLDFTTALSTAPPPAARPDFIAWFDMEGQLFQKARDLFETLRTNPEIGAAMRSKALLPRREVTLRAPVPRPGKVICIGRNYRDHAAEGGVEIPERPLIFSKFATSIIGPGETVRIPPGSEKVDYEAELAVVIGARARNVSADRALDFVLGYANFNDVSARDFQFGDGQWQRGKSCDTFAPIGPYIATTDEIPSPHELRIRLRLNGDTMQDSNTDQMIFGVPQLIAAITESVTLEPGDVIATGTPHGVGFARKPPVWLKPGDELEVEIEGLGVLRNTMGS